MGSLGVNVPALIVVGISLVIGLVMVVVFRYTSDQKAIHVAKDRLKAHLLALRLFQDQIPVVLRSYGRIVLATGRYLRLAFKPLLFVIVPLTFLIVQLDRYLGSMPVEVGHPFLITVRMDNLKASNEASLQLPDGLATTAPAVHVPSENEIAWRVVAEKPGQYIVNVQASDETFSKRRSGWGRLVALVASPPSREILGAYFCLWRTRSAREQSYRVNRRAVFCPEHRFRWLSNGTGSGCSLFCLWPQVFFSRVFLGLKYEVERNNISG